MEPPPPPQVPYLVLIFKSVAGLETVGRCGCGVCVHIYCMCS